MNPAQVLQAAFDHHRNGDLSGAEARCREILIRQPDDPDALHLLGIIAHQVGRNDTAATLVQRALHQRPDSPEIHNNLGQVLEAQGRTADALAEYRRAIQLRPDFPEAYNNCGNTLKALGRYSEAIAAYETAIRLRPAYAKAFHNLGISLHLAGQKSAALAAFYRAVQLDQRWSEGHRCIGDILRENGDCEGAATAYRTALTISPHAPPILNNLALALRQLGRVEEAITTIESVLKTQPELISAQLNLATFLREQGDFSRSIATFRSVLEHTEIPATLHSGFVFLLHYDPTCPARRLLAEHQRWTRVQTADVPEFPCVEAQPSDRDRRLRIGYVSADLRTHPVGRNVHPLFAHHDHERFEIHAYAHVDDPDRLTERLQTQVDHWHDVTALNDEQLAGKVRTDGIDILVDLSLHTDGNRLLAFARRPAPIQVTFAGYPGTTGLTAIDYRLTDPFLDPPGTRDELYSEKSLRLPNSFWCFDPLDDAVAPRSISPPASAPITWGCLNNPIKINESVLEPWAEIMQATPGSRLLVLAHNAYHRDRIRRGLERRGIDSARIEFVPKQPRPAYLATYARCDIILDTFPYGGHTTTCDALWMGVPVVTLIGETAVGRGGFSLLSNLGLARLTAGSEPEYVRIALALAHDRAELAHLHSTLRARMEQSSLMDAHGFARGIESAYRCMWQAWCEKAAS